jgi:hypothetical protein
VRGLREQLGDIWAMVNLRSIYQPCAAIAFYNICQVRLARASSPASVGGWFVSLSRLPVLSPISVAYFCPPLPPSSLRGWLLSPSLPCLPPFPPRMFPPYHTAPGPPVSKSRWWDGR